MYAKQTKGSISHFPLEGSAIPGTVWLHHSNGGLRRQMPSPKYPPSFSPVFSMSTMPSSGTAAAVPHCTLVVLAPLQDLSPIPAEGNMEHKPMAICSPTTALSVTGMRVPKKCESAWRRVKAMEHWAAHSCTQKQDQIRKR